jgi:hypothetical protein
MSVSFSLSIAFILRSVYATVPFLVKKEVKMRKMMLSVAVASLSFVSFVHPGLAEGRKRTISAEEYQFALSLFQREFPPRDQITITDETGFGNRPYVRPTVGQIVGEGYIRINLGRNYDNPLSSRSVKGLFAHELTHAWQIEHYGLTWYGRQAVRNQVIAGDSYTYNCNPNKKLR